MHGQCRRRRILVAAAAAVVIVLANRVLHRRHQHTRLPLHIRVLRIGLQALVLLNVPY